MCWAPAQKIKTSTFQGFSMAANTNHKIRWAQKIGGWKGKISILGISQ